MLLAVHALDFGVIGLFLLTVLAVGAFFARQQRTFSDFAVGGRSLMGITAGVSAAVTLLAAYPFVVLPGEAYDAGLKWLLAPIGVCLAAPLVMVFVLPLLSNLEITSIYEYLEMRFGPVCRWAAAGIWIVWRVVWLTVVIGLPCHFLALAAGGTLPAWVWIVVVGVVATVPACLGGLKAVVWTDVLQASAMIVALLVVVGAVWLSMDDGAATVWRVADDFGRTQVADLSLSEDKSFPWDAPWSFYNALPFFVLLMLVLSVTDQTVLQRLLAAKNMGHCRRGYLWGAVIFALLLGGLTYVGVGLFAFYQKNANSLRPVWVVNLDNQTHQSLTFADRDRILDKTDAAAEAPEGGDSGQKGETTSAADDDKPLVPWDTDLRDRKTLERLVAGKRILRPNSKRPFDRVDELIDFRTDELDVDALAMKKAEGKLSNRVYRLVLHARAEQELLPHFVSSRLGMGLLGLVLVGILAASMASFDSGVHSLSTVLLVDFHRRGGIGRSFFATRLGKSVAQLTDSDELKLARPMTAVVGLLAIVLALVLGSGSNLVWLLYALTMIVGAPLLAVFALGIFSRSATGAGACVGLVAGIVLTAWIVIGSAMSGDGGARAWFWPWPPVAASWAMICGLVGTFSVGWMVSLAAGRRRSRQELRGLVWGIGRLGEQEIVLQAISIPGEEDPVDGDDSRWRH